MTVHALTLAAGVLTGALIAGWLLTGTGDEHWWPRELDRLDRECDRLAGLYLQEAGR